METVATTFGLHPLPDDAKRELADLKGHQKGDLIDGDEGEAITSVYDRARREVIDAQVAAGLDVVTEGQLRWDDMLAHPLAVHDAVETRGIVRYYDNNNFYREPAVVGDLTHDGDVAAELDAAAADLDGRATLGAVLPGPYTLADLAVDEHYGDEAAFLDAVASFLAGEAEGFPDDVGTLSLLEPSLVTDPPGSDRVERAVEAVEAVAGAVDADVLVHTYWGVPGEQVHAHLVDADVDALGYDLVTDPHGVADLVQEYGTTADVALGLVDGQNTAVASVDTIRDRVAWFRDAVEPTTVEDVYAAPNTELFYLPVSRYREQLDELGSATAPEVTA